MYRFPAVLAIAGACLLPSAALAQKVEVDYAHGTDFSKYKTYKWVQTENPQISPLSQQRITAAIDSELAKKGFTKTEDNPSLLVRYLGAVKEQTQLNTYSTGTGGWGYGPRWGYGYGANMGSSMSTTTSSTIPVGELVVDLYDPEQKQLVFRGIASDTLSSKAEKNTKKIQKAMEKMFKKYPPKG